MYRMKTGYHVGDAMTVNPVVISPLKTLKEASRIMSKEHVGALLIKDKDNITGIITEQDIVRKAVAELKDPEDRKVSDIMETNLVTIAPEEDIFEALRIMAEYNIRHLPVMKNNNFSGLITMKDILKIEPDLYEILVDKISLREIERKPVR